MAVEHGPRRRLPLVPPPATRAECKDGPRPCPSTGCVHHLWTETAHRGRPLENRLWPRVNPREGDTCELDVADRGERTLEETAAALGVSKQAASLAEQIAIRSRDAMATARRSIDEIRTCSQCPCRDGTSCAYPGEAEREVPDMGVPDWCPLRRHPLVLVVRVATKR